MSVQGDSGEPVELVVDVGFGHGGMRAGQRYFSAPFLFGRHCGILWVQYYALADGAPGELRIALKLFTPSVFLHFLGFYVETPSSSVNDDGFLSHVWPDGVLLRTTHARFLSVGDRRQELRDRLLETLSSSEFARIRVFIAAVPERSPPSLSSLLATGDEAPESAPEDGEEGADGEGGGEDAGTAKSAIVGL